MIRLWVWTYSELNLSTTRSNDLLVQLLGRNVADELVDVKFRVGAATERALLLELAKRAGFALIETVELSSEADRRRRRHGL